MNTPPSAQHAYLSARTDTLRAQHPFRTMIVGRLRAQRHKQSVKILSSVVEKQRIRKNGRSFSNMVNRNFEKSSYLCGVNSYNSFNSLSKI